MERSRGSWPTHDEPVGWCSVAPRDAFPGLDRSRTLKRIDSEPVWSVVCFFIARPFRRKGLSVQLLRAAAEYVRERGGMTVEGYPVIPRKRIADTWAYCGTSSAFLQVGFEEAARPTAGRAVMRYRIVG